ncbi:MAG: glycosyltransferase family 2 protein [Gammaproteobacteria bacterium]|nr:glycosyltransferase family 2 protein [Gammaproteobacteria bacterium]
MCPAALSVSLVTFRPDFELLTLAVEHLRAAVVLLGASDAGVVRLVAVDNDPGGGRGDCLQALLREHWQAEGREFAILTGHGNVGYGQGHNMAIAQSSADYHLILNPDVLVAEDALRNALEFMANNPDVGLLAPAFVDEDGSLRHLCKAYPTVIDLALRGFAPDAVKRIAHRRLTRYEMKTIDPHAVRRGVPLISGSFMLFRRRVLARIGGFSKDYFLYFEDFDLSLRAAKFTTVAYVPSVRIVHKGGYASRKGIRHWWMFGRSAYTFFSRHGWKWI